MKKNKNPNLRGLNTKKKPVKTQSIARKILKIFVLFTIIIIPVETASYLYIKFYRKEIIPIVNYLKTAKPINQFQGCISQSYLNYIPSPGYKLNGYLQHNKHGYRGQLIPQTKTSCVIFA